MRATGEVGSVDAFNENVGRIILNPPLAALRLQRIQHRTRAPQLPANSIRFSSLSGISYFRTDHHPG
ncbi:hypothetical protein CDD80_3842 [Ophiocordyceps camponoti-rufipedis]|uniref:Uncharacterized protein n=1 Tax=Ophiocordyceps camponoti-rufipedis TaxID=2004952 RepID=A0A2C5Z0K6_9HYPO|nr:hypothetical protein CDD80_3842 [Ophiocordyceps camponoti-rufipedis]